MDLVAGALIVVDTTWIQAAILAHATSAQYTLVRAIVLASRAGRLARLMRHLNLLQVLHVRPAPAARAHSRAAPTRAPEERRPPAHVPACLHCTAKR